jgi:integrase
MKWLSHQDWDFGSEDEKVVQWTNEIVDIPKRAPKLQAKVDLLKHRRKKKQNNNKEKYYSLKPEQLASHPLLPKQIETLQDYWTLDYVPERRGEPKIRSISWQNYKKHYLRFLGWQLHVEQQDWSSLNLHSMANEPILNSYLKWHSKRGNSVNYLVGICAAALNVAKCVYGAEFPGTAWENIPPVKTIREISKTFSKAAKDDENLRTVSQKALEDKLLELDQCIEIVKYLRQCCAVKNYGGKLRPNKSIIDSWQDYLLVSSLTFTPVRQLEIRNLEIGKNLTREADGWWVNLTSQEHKTGSKTGKGRSYPLFAGSMKDLLTRDLDEYVNKWRPIENLPHQYLFFLRGGNQHPECRGLPIPDAKHLSKLIPTLMFRMTAIVFGPENAKHPSPHDFRRIFVTWLYRYGSYDEWIIYAEVLGHSIETAMKTYSKLTSRDRTEGANAAYHKVAQRAQQKQAEKQNPDNKVFLSAWVDKSVLDSLPPNKKSVLIELGFFHNS